MIKVIFAVFIVIQFCAFIGCENYFQESAVDDNRPQQEVTVPEPDTVSYNTIPQPFTEDIYFLYGGGLHVPELKFANADVRLILQKLLEEGFALKDAWNATGEWGCPMDKPTWEQLIVRLEKPEPRILDFGFVTDSSRIQIFENPPCKPNWEYYRFQ